MKYLSGTVMASMFLLALGACSDGEEAAAVTSRTTDPAAPWTSPDAPVMKVTDYDFDSARGRALFVQRQCVICHSVNGVGGQVAVALDKQTFLSEIDPVEFSARIWRGAPDMLRLQSTELGYQVNLSAQDIADLAAFAGDPAEQRKLTIDQVPQDTQAAFLDEFAWDDGEYPVSNPDAY